MLLVLAYGFILASTTPTFSEVTVGTMDKRCGYDDVGQPYSLSKCVKQAPSADQSFAGRLKDAKKIIQERIIYPSHFANYSWSRKTVEVVAAVKDNSLGYQFLYLARDICSAALSVIKCVAFEGLQLPCEFDIGPFLNSDNIPLVWKYPTVIHTAGITSCSAVANYVAEELQYHEEQPTNDFYATCGASIIKWDSYCDNMDPLESEMGKLVTRYNLRMQFNETENIQYVLKYAIAGAKCHPDLKNALAEYCRTMNNYVQCIDDRSFLKKCPFSWNFYVENAVEVETYDMYEMVEHADSLYELNIESCNRYVDKLIEDDVSNICGNYLFTQYDYCNNSLREIEELHKNMTSLVSEYNISLEYNDQDELVIPILVYALQAAGDFEDLKVVVAEYCREMNNFLACAEENIPKLNCQFSWAPILSDDAAKWLVEPVGNEVTEIVNKSSIEECKTFVKIIKAHM